MRICDKQIIGIGILHGLVMSLHILFSLILITWGTQDTLWAYYGGDMSATRFSPLNDITPANVHSLQQEWNTTLPFILQSYTVPIVIDDGS